MILLDTHAAAWLATRPQRLSSQAASAIRRAQAADGLAIAAITLLELAQLLARGTLRCSGTPQDWLRRFVEATRVAVRDVTVEIASVAAYLPPSFPSDPFDRVIAATAIVEGMPLVTSDARVQGSKVVRTIW